MSDAYWERLKEIFHTAVALPPSKRVAYLSHASNNDADLRQAIEALLKAHEEDVHFVDIPAFQAAAEMLVEDNELAPNQKVAHYRIISLLGIGGMGRVYLAEDTRLHRQVALKFLSRNLTQDHERLRRFEQEAHAASALNHPNILTIHEIGESGNHRFIATEFIEGETLRERLSAGIKIDEAVEIATQIASALVAAHRVGVVHRDIKPENIMIRRDDGLVKVLDFGLAKMSRVASLERPKRVELRKPEEFQTGPGVVLGTVAYMSPEQARGGEVDMRTDIWSLGVVVYEMLAGTSPFIAATSNEIVSAILAKTPAPPLAHFVTGVPEPLEKIVQRVLSKDEKERYQNSTDLLADLRRVSASVTSASGERDKTTIASLLQGSRTDVQPVRRSTSPNVDYIANQVKTHKRGSLAFAAILLLCIATGVFIFERRSKDAVAVAAKASQIRSLAVLPLKSLDSSENYLGVGIANAVISRVSQTGQVTVRPTTAVLKYQKEDKDSLTAARELSADAILEGTVQRAGDRLRVTVNLLRTNDGVSLYSDNFDLTTSDVFAIQDQVAQQVASRLNVSFQSTSKYPTDPKAYEYYIRGLASLDERGYNKDAMPQMLTTINYFNQSIAIDPKFAPSHAKLAFAYAWTATLSDPESSHWAELSKEQIRLAQELDSNLAETHFAHAYLLWTRLEGYQIEAAIRELRLAKKLNPNSCSPDLPALLGHMGLEDLAVGELQRALNIDPTSQSLKDLKLILPHLRGDTDAWLAANQQIPSNFVNVDPWYYLRKGLLDDAQKAIDERRQKAANDPQLLLQQALLLALRGKLAQAKENVPAILAQVQSNPMNRHHLTYDAACIYALSGDSTDAVKWLRETANTGFPNYSLFERDPFLNRIRQSPEFIQFMSEQKAHWEELRDEFARE